MKPVNPPPNTSEANREIPSEQRVHLAERAHLLPLSNYTLSTVCPACNAPTYKLACKVRCGKCGFMWDCSEL